MDKVNIGSFSVFEPDAVRSDSFLVGGARPLSSGPTAALMDARYEFGKIIAYLQARSTVGGVVYVAPSGNETYDVTEHEDWENVRRVSVIANTENGELTIQLPEQPKGGDTVNLISYGDWFDKNPVHLNPGVEIINGQTTPVVVNLPGINLTLIYISEQVGWALLQKGDTLVVNDSVSGFDNAPKAVMDSPSFQVPPNFQNGVLVLGQGTNAETLTITLPNSEYLSSPWGFKLVSRTTPTSVQFLSSNGETVIGRLADPDSVSPGTVGDICYLGDGVFSTPS